jgi:hypothetical protein
MGSDLQSLKEDTMAIDTEGKVKGAKDLKKNNKDNKTETHKKVVMGTSWFSWKKLAIVGGAIAAVGAGILIGRRNASHVGDAVAKSINEMAKL